MSLANGCGHCQGVGVMQDRTLCAFPYEPPISLLLLGAKFADKSRWGAMAAHWGWARLGRELQGLQVDGVVPVPLHEERLRKRGFNQAALLAKPLAKALRRPLLTDLLFRPVATLPQTRLDRKAREANMRGVFRAQWGERAVAEHLLLVDDTMTTGATVREAAAALKKSGVGQVTVMVLAKAMRDTARYGG